MKVTRIYRKTSYLLMAALISAALVSCRSDSNVEEPARNQQSATDYVAQADRLYAQREELLRLRQGIVLLKEARTADFSSYDAAWRLAKFDYYLATHTDQATERDAAFREGIEAGKAAVKLQDGKPDGHFWLGANYGGSAQTGTLAGLSTVEDIRGEMQTVLKLDEGYQDGSAYMVLGLVYLNAPKLLGGDPQKAVEEMEKGLRFGQANAFLHLHLAEAYLKVERTDAARQQLNAILNMTPDPNYLPEYKEATAQARQMLEKIG